MGKKALLVSNTDTWHSLLNNTFIVEVRKKNPTSEALTQGRGVSGCSGAEGVTSSCCNSQSRQASVWMHLWPLVLNKTSRLSWPAQLVFWIQSEGRESFCCMMGKVVGCQLEPLWKLHILCNTTRSWNVQQSVKPILLHLPFLHHTEPECLHGEKQQTAGNYLCHYKSPTIQVFLAMQWPNATKEGEGNVQCPACGTVISPSIPNSKHCLSFFEVECKDRLSFMLKHQPQEQHSGGEECHRWSLVEPKKLNR